MSKKETEVAKAEETTVSKSPSFGAFGNMGREDFKVPRICLGQKVGDLADLFPGSEGKYIDNLEGTVFGDEANPMEVVILGMSKAWRISNAETKDYMRTVPFTDENSAWEWEGEDTQRDGTSVHVRRSLTWSYYILPVKNLGDVPSVIALKNSSREAAKTLNSILRRVDARGLAPYSQTYLFGVATEKQNKNTFFVPTIRVGRATTPAEQATCEYWYSVFKRGALTPESDEPEEVKAPQPTKQAEVQDGWY